MDTRTIRKVVRIDEEKCDGCGLCIPHCKEGALQIVDGKARLVSETYCDGLGACLGHCPRGAITIEEREADGFDEKAAEQHIRARHGARENDHHFSEEHRCPSARIMTFRAKMGTPVGGEGVSSSRSQSALSQWPVQLALVPVSAPYLRGADLLIAADCVPFAYAGFHRDFLRGKKVLIACPKLDDISPYLHKLAGIFAECGIRSVTVVHMEVPCCFGLVKLVQEALELAEKDISVEEVTVSVRGEILREGAGQPAPHGSTDVSARGTPPDPDGNGKER